MRLLLWLIFPVMGHATYMVYKSQEPRGIISAAENDPCMNNSTCYALIEGAMEDTLALGDYLPTSSPTEAPTPAPKGNGNGNGNGRGDKMLRGRRELISCDYCELIYGTSSRWICIVFLQCTEYRRSMLSTSLAGATETESHDFLVDTCWKDSESLTPAFHDAVMAKLPPNDPNFDGVSIKLQQYHYNCDLLF